MKERLDFMKSINAVEGQERVIDRGNLTSLTCIGECPIDIKFVGEKAGGVRRDAFWEKAYTSKGQPC